MDAADVAEIFRLSPVQEYLLRASVGSSDEQIERQVVAIQYREVDFAHLESAWRDAQRRFPLLRTSFHWEGMSSPVQVVWREAALPTRHLDWSGMDRHERRESLHALIESERRTPLRLDAAPLMRLAFVRSDRGGYVVWTYRPLIADRLSAGLILEAVQHAWAAYRRGTTPTAEALDDGFRRLVDRLQRGDEESARNYWRERLSGTVLATKFSPASSSEEFEPSERAAEADRDSLRTARHHLGTKVAEALHATAATHAVDLGSLLLAAVAVISARESVGGGSSIVIGLTVPGRPGDVPEAERSAGPFENLVPLKIDWDPDERVGRWMRAIQERREDLKPYEFFPLSRIDDWVGADREEPRFGIVADVCPSSPKDLRGRVVGEAPNRRRRRAAKVILAPQLRRSREVVVRLEAEGDRLSLRLRYDGRRLHWLDADRLLRELESALAALAERYDRPLGEILERVETPTVVPLHPGPTASEEDRCRETAAYCVHPAGGGVSCYAALAQHLGRHRPTFGLEAPDVSAVGRNASVEDLAAEHFRRLVEFQPEGPYVLVGWSFGGLLACEVAHQLTESGREVSILALIDPAFGPERSDRFRGRSLSHALLDFARQMGWPAPKRSPRRVSVRQLAERLLTRARQAMLAPPEMTASSLIEQCQSYASHVSAARAYRPKAYDGPTLAILPETARGRTQSAETEINLTNADPTPTIMSWAFAEDRCQIVFAKGTHATLLRPPYVESVAERIAAALRRPPADRIDPHGSKRVGERPAGCASASPEAP